MHTKSTVAGIHGHLRTGTCAKQIPPAPHLRAVKLMLIKGIRRFIFSGGGGGGGGGGVGGVGGRCGGAGG